MTPLLWALVVLAVWLVVIALPIGYFVGRAVKRNTSEPPPHAGDLLDLEDIDWDFPRRDVA